MLVRELTVERVLAYATLISLFIGAVATWAVAFSRIGTHEERLDKHAQQIEKIEKDETIKLKLAQIQESVNYLGWRMDLVTKQLDSKPQPP